MEQLINQYKVTGDFTHEQKVQFFIKPSAEVLNMIKKSNDFNFCKTCMNAFLDYNPDDVVYGSYTDFVKTPVIKQIMKAMLLTNND